MYKYTFKTCQARRDHQRGISLVIVLILLVVIGLTSAAAIRNATSGEKATNNVRMQNLAQQYAEASLRYCESELRKADDGTRVATLSEANIVPIADGAVPAWSNTASWTGGGGAFASLTELPTTQISSADSAFRPSKLPQCIVELQSLADASTAYVITARGFSPGYTANAGTGATESGSVVWLQSTVKLN